MGLVINGNWFQLYQITEVKRETNNHFVLFTSTFSRLPFHKIPLDFQRSFSYIYMKLNRIRYANNQKYTWTLSIFLLQFRLQRTETCSRPERK